MHHRALAAAVLTILLPAAALGGSPPTGTIACAIVSEHSQTHPSGLLFHPYINAVSRMITVKAKNVDSVSCDATNVTGGKFPITAVRFDLSAKFPDGNCAAFTSAPALERGQIKVRWLGPNSQDLLRTVATSKATIATATYDSGSHALILTTAPLDGAFAGTTATLHLGFDDYIAGVEAGCSETGGLLGLAFGDPNPSSIDVQ